VTTHCHLITHTSSGETWPATVVNLSTNGLALTLQRRFEKGAPLVVPVLGRDEQPLRLLVCRVARVSGQGDGTWVLGCLLASPLAPQDIQALLEALTDRVEVRPAGFVPHSRAEAALLRRKAGVR
jgi:hypothetical protein